MLPLFVQLPPPTPPLRLPPSFLQACTSADAKFLPSTDSDRDKEFDGNACRFFCASHRDVGWSLPKTEYKVSAPHGWDSDWLESNREKLDDTSDSFFARFLAAWQDANAICMHVWLHGASKKTVLPDVCPKRLKKRS